MKPFSKNETISLAFILIILFSVTLFNIRIAERRSRDAQRRADLGAIYEALEKFHSDFGFFPSSDNGKIKACRGENYQEVLDELAELEQFDLNLYISGLRGCEWGRDALSDPTGETDTPYLVTIPIDPKSANGITYLYLANSSRFQIYTYLEGGNEEIGYSEPVIKRNLSCGKVVCNSGRAYSETPLDISIDEYEQVLIDNQKSGK